MYNIAVCDDDSKVTEIICEYLQEKGRQLPDVKLNISTYESGESFIRDVESGKPCHIVFLDVQMDGLDGIEVGYNLRTLPMGEDTVLIFISSHKHYFEGIAKVGTFGFIEKPIDVNELDNIFSRALKSISRYSSYREKVFQYNVNRDIHSIKIDELVYLESESKLLHIYLWDKQNKKIYLYDNFYSSIESAMKQLPKEHFIHCQRSYVVNANFVKWMDQKNFVLIDNNGTTISIGRTYKNKVKAAYIKQRGNQYE